MPELYWIGKQSVVDYAGKVNSGSLRHIPEVSVAEDSGNKIIHGDNLRALKTLLPDYRERVKLVFIDPPYNADGEVWTYGDHIEAPDVEHWPGKVEVDDPLRRDKWLSMMYPRLMLLRELLRTDGTIFITIGDNEIHHLRLLLDEVFGARNFLGCAVWRKGPSDGGEKPIPSVHNYVVIYARDKNLSVLDGSGVTTWWTAEMFGDSLEARHELETIFPETENLFAIPKPTRLARRILKLATVPSNGDVVLDCFAGSGTTAQAVLDQNASDSGDRRFILIEAENFAETLTAERVRRVIPKKGGPHPTSGFVYYELDG